jgi:hypothetical protein
MNRSAWISALMRSNLPQNIMRTFGYRRKRNRNMGYSLMGVAVSAAAAYLFRNRMGGMRQLFQNSNMSTGYNRPVTAGLTEFARELTDGMNGKSHNSEGSTGGSGYHSASSTNPESSEIINQIASSVKETGNGQQADQLANKLIQKNL